MFSQIMWTSFVFFSPSHLSRWYFIVFCVFFHRLNRSDKKTHEKNTNKFERWQRRHRWNKNKKRQKRQPKSNQWQLRIQLCSISFHLLSPHRAKATIYDFSAERIKKKQKKTWKSKQNKGGRMAQFVCCKSNWMSASKSSETIMLSFVWLLRLQNDPIKSISSRRCRRWRAIHNHLCCSDANQTHSTNRTKCLQRKYFFERQKIHFV